MANKKKAKTTKWSKPRHAFFGRLANGLLALYIKMVYGFSPTKFKGDRKRQYLVLINHQTPLDQFFVTISMRKSMYFLGSEDLFSAGIGSKIMKYTVAPIPIRKQATDFASVMTCAKVAKEGKSLLLSPEGNRTYSGKTEFINPSIIKFIRLLKLPLLLYRIEGGYGVYPRWSDKARKGKMKAYVHKIVEYDEYSKMSDEELLALVRAELYVNEACLDNEYYSKNNAEYLERLIYVCPDCGLSEFYSKGNFLYCKKCGKKVEYLPNKTLASKDPFPFTFVNDWYEYQKEFVASLDLSEYYDKPMFKDSVLLSQVEVFKKKTILDKNARVSLFGNRIEISADGELLNLDFSDVSVVTVLGRNKLNVYYKDLLYQFKGGKSFNAVKYVNVYYRHKNLVQGDKDGKFLGL